MSIYKRILVATDFTDINQFAIKRASLLAEQDNCVLILFHVIEHFPTDSGPLSSVFQYSAEPDNSLIQYVSSKLLKQKNTIEYQDVKTEFRVTSKSARHEILRFAKAHEVDLIVVAPHGEGIIGTLGSTATGVLNNAPCDVLAVRETEKSL